MDSKRESFLAPRDAWIFDNIPIPSTGSQLHHLSKFIFPPIRVFFSFSVCVCGFVCFECQIHLLVWGTRNGVGPTATEVWWLRSLVSSAPHQAAACQKPTTTKQPATTCYYWPRHLSKANKYSWMYNHRKEKPTTTNTVISSQTHGCVCI